MAENTIKTRIQLKSDTEANWKQAVLTSDNSAGTKTTGTSFKPKKGEAIIFSNDSTHPFSRLKIGDGNTDVLSLPFIDSGSTNGFVFKEYFADFPSNPNVNTLYYELSTNSIFQWTQENRYQIKYNLKTTYTASDGIEITNGVIKHTNTGLTAQNTQAVYPIKIDAQGHIKEYGNAITIDAAAGKGVDTSIENSPTNNNLPTSLAVKNYVDNSFAANDAMVFKGILDHTATSPLPSGTFIDVPMTDYKIGWTYRVVTAGNYINNITNSTHEVCEAGDLIIAINDGPNNSSDITPNDWTIVQTNLEGVIAITSPNTGGIVYKNNSGYATTAQGLDGQLLATTQSGIQWKTFNAGTYPTLNNDGINATFSVSNGTLTLVGSSFPTLSSGTQPSFS